MIIQLGFYRRKPGLSVKEFWYLWSEVYGRLYADHPELKRYLRRYVQHRLTPVESATSGDLPYDGFSEAWFDTLEASEALCRESLYLEHIAPLAESFLDLENSKLTAYDSQIYQVGGPPPLFAG